MCCVYFSCRLASSLINHSHSSLSLTHPRVGAARGFMEYLDSAPSPTSIDGIKKQVVAVVHGTAESDENRSKIFDFFGEGDRGRINQFLDRTVSGDVHPIGGQGLPHGTVEKKVLLPPAPETEPRNRKVWLLFNISKFSASYRFFQFSGSYKLFIPTLDKPDVKDLSGFL
jgi:hypothetical protein